MLVVYASKTGNIERFLKKTGIINVCKINDSTSNKTQDFLGKSSITSGDILNENFILLTYTTGIGEIPLEVSNFMKNNFRLSKGLIGSGNKNWGGAFCNSLTLLNQQYNIPILMRFEMSGNKHDVEKFLEIYDGFLGAD